MSRAMMTDERSSQTATPPEALSDRRAAVLMAVIAQPRPTVRSICKATGGLSTSTVHAHLEAWRDEGLVTWDDDRRGTLRANVEVRVVAPRRDWQ